MVPAAEKLNKKTFNIAAPCRVCPPVIRVFPLKEIPRIQIRLIEEGHACSYVVHKVQSNHTIIRMFLQKIEYCGRSMVFSTILRKSRCIMRILQGIVHSHKVFRNVKISRYSYCMQIWPNDSFRGYGGALHDFLANAKVIGQKYWDFSLPQNRQYYLFTKPSR